jgi:hypothetical protein
MIRNLLGHIARGASKVFGAIQGPVRKFGQIAGAVGQFALQNHAQLALGAHALANMTGNPTAQKITGGVLAASTALTGIENHVSNRIAEMRAHHAQPNANFRPNQFNTKI